MGIKAKIEFKMNCHWELTFRNVHTGIIRTCEFDNIMVTTGLNMIAKRLAQVGNDCNITYVAVGTNNTAPVVGDTTLGTELDRNTVTAISASGAVVSISGFFGVTEANGSLEEWALFGEAASGSADSGTMFNHALFSETKSSSETLTMEITITFV